MANKIALPVAGGLLSGLMLGALMTGIPGAMLFLYAVPLPLFLAGLSFGTVASAIAVGAGTGAAFALGGVAVGGLFLALFGAPAILIVWLALSSRTDARTHVEWYPPGKLLGWLSIIAATGFLAAALLASDAEGGLEGHIRRMLPQAIQLLFDGPLPEELARQIDQWAGLFPAMLATVWIGTTVLNAAVAQSVLARRGKAMRPSPDWLMVEAPAWTPYAFSAAVILKAVGPGGFGFVGENLAPVLAMPYFFVGIAVVHALARRTPIRTLALVIFYMILILLGFFAMVLVVALGFAETWLAIRQRATAVRRS
jgi:hypothetical protein